MWGVMAGAFCTKPLSQPIQQQLGHLTQDTKIGWGQCPNTCQIWRIYPICLEERKVLPLISQYSAMLAWIACWFGVIKIFIYTSKKRSILSIVLCRMNVDEDGDMLRKEGWHHESVGDNPGEKLNFQIDNLIVYILKVLRSISTGNPAKVSHFISSPPTSFYISLQQFCGKGRTYNTSFIRKLLFLGIVYWVCTFPLVSHNELIYLLSHGSKLTNFCKRFLLI